MIHQKNIDNLYRIIDEIQTLESGLIIKTQQMEEECQYDIDAAITSITDVILCLEADDALRDLVSR